MLNELIEKLRVKRLKVTHQRLQVYKALMELDHPYVDEIVSIVRKTNAYISVATVYCVLELFENEGLVTRLETANGKIRYDGVMTKHFHMYDESKDKLTNYDDDYLMGFLSAYFEKASFGDLKLKNIRLQLVGTK